MIKMGGDISLNIISEHIKGLLNYNKVSTDFERMIACWVLGGMKPKLSLFVKELNDLAQKEKKPEDKDFSDPSQIDKDNVA